jgi:hypothetical protein
MTGRGLRMQGRIANRPFSWLLRCFASAFLSVTATGPRPVASAQRCPWCFVMQEGSHLVDVRQKCPLRSFGCTILESFVDDHAGFAFINAACSLHVLGQKSPLSFLLQYTLEARGGVILPCVLTTGCAWRSSPVGFARCGIVGTWNPDGSEPPSFSGSRCSLRGFGFFGG